MEVSFMVIAIIIITFLAITITLIIIIITIIISFIMIIVIMITIITIITIIILFIYSYYDYLYRNCRCTTSCHFLCFSLFYSSIFMMIIHWSTGDVGSGKTTLFARLRGEKPSPEVAGQGTGVEFTYVDVREEDSEGLCPCF